MAQAILITRRDILNHAAGSDVVNWFKLRPVEVQILTGGALGTMIVQWRYLGGDTWTGNEGSNAGATWEWEIPDPAFATITFPAATYVAAQAWTIAVNGTVTPQGATPAGPTATRDDVVTKTCEAVTSDIVTWCQPRVVPPILSLGEGQKGWGARIANYRLKSRQGLTPSQAGTGDENLRALALDAEENFKGIGESAMRPPDIIDSSTSNLGAGLSALPISDTSRGWD